MPPLTYNHAPQSTATPNTLGSTADFTPIPEGQFAPPEVYKPKDVAEVFHLPSEGASTVPEEQPLVVSNAEAQPIANPEVPVSSSEYANETVAMQEITNAAGAIMQMRDREQQ